jgi:SAM-dependent methyltransferase
MTDLEVKQRDDITFKHHYVHWRQVRIDKIEQIFGKEFFKDKTVLELACGYGDIGKYFKENLQADVTFAEGRVEHFPYIRGNVPDCKIIHINQENSWELETKYDVIIHFGVMYHLDNWKQDLECTLRHSDLIILETEVADSNDPTFEQKFIDSVSYDQAMGPKLLATRPSAAYIESVFTENGFSFVRYDHADLNSDLNNYSWEVTGSAESHKTERSVGVGKRRFWVVRKIN